jgi:hypothetical protein
MAEVGVSGAGRHHQRVVLDGGRVATVEQHAPPAEIEPAHLAEDHAGIALALEQRAQRGGDLGGGQRTGGHLVEQWLEQVEVAPVDQRDLDGRAS